MTVVLDSFRLYELCQKYAKPMDLLLALVFSNSCLKHELTFNGNESNRFLSFFTDQQNQL